MRKQLFLIGMLCTSCILFAQTDRLWTTETQRISSEIFEDKSSITQPKTFRLDINGLRNSLSKAPKQQSAEEKPGVIISFPNAEGKMESFKVWENSNFDPQLAAKYPEIKSYIGESIDDPSNTVYFSISPLGLSFMEIYNDRSAVFIEPYTKDLSTYVVYKRSDKKDQLNAFECGVVDTAQKSVSQTAGVAARPNADDAKLRTLRLALSCTGEYAAYFGGTKPNALAAMNNTMTRVNGIFEKDFSARMVLIPNNDVLIYTNSSTDPYSSSQEYGNQLQANLTANIGEANYDIGHLLSGITAGGNAGCIGCICTNGWKGKGWSSQVLWDSTPTGDSFDMIVAHEMGHQFGANHTFSYLDEATDMNVEPGSGSTIMSYAGVTNGYNVQQFHDTFFHAISIQQVTNNLKRKTCPVITSTGNSIPTANAGADYTIPKGTPFMLTGTGTDANGDTLTYIWEQMDEMRFDQTGANSVASSTKDFGPTFRSWSPSTSPVRYFPKMSSILNGATTTQGLQIPVEALSDVARIYQFRFTVRDNRAGGSGNNSDDAVLYVNAATGPFMVTSQNSATAYVAGSSQIITWNVAGTTGNGVNTPNVDILWSKDSGVTWTTLIAGTPNDGSQAVTIPNVSTTTGRIMVKGSNHIFFDVNNGDITVNDIAAPTPPVLSASGTSFISTNLSWSGATDNVGVTGYDIYKGSSLIGSTTTGTTYTVTGLTPGTTYSFFVKAKDAAGNISGSSNIVSVTTGSSYCNSQASMTQIGRIQNVKFAGINNTSTGLQGYENFTSVSGNVTKGGSYAISVTPQMPLPNQYIPLYVVYIDYNGDGDFTDLGERVYVRVNYDYSPFTANIIIPSNVATGATRMRVVLKLFMGNLLVPSPCESFPYGQVEDYTINIGPGGISRNSDVALTGEGQVTGDLISAMKVYPNPASDILHISDTTSEAYTIFDLSGKLISSGHLEKGTVKVNTLANGAYIIRIKDTSIRFIKN